MRNQFVRAVRRFRPWMAMLCLFAFLLPCPAYAADAPQTFTFANPYGVFLSCDATQTDRFADYQTVVMDAAYFTQGDVAALKAAGHTVYTYLNVGSLEDFRPYYDRFAGQTLAAYQNWEGERWMDVSDPAWQTFLTDTLASEALAKGVDGFFVDNCDVYYLYPTHAIYNGLCTVLRALRATGAEVIINGGDAFVTAYADEHGGISDIMTGVNQESVLSSIHFDDGTFGRASTEDCQYFMEYVQRVSNLGGKVFLLEYTQDQTLASEIKAYCDQMGYVYYLSDSIELD